MLELLSPAGSMDALRAAVQNGANAVYLGAGSFNARAGARNFSDEELTEAVRYCHIRGVKVHFTLNTLVTDREFSGAEAALRTAVRAGVDAVIIQDLGLLAMCRRVAPGLPIHASTQMSIHSSEGVAKAAELGISRVVLARELSRDQIAGICRSSPVEIEVFVHGALCMSYSGQCLMSAVIGRRSGNRGRCAQPCRMRYGYDRSGNGAPLSLKDNCLVSVLDELKKMGVSCLKIEGRMKRPEYVAVTTGIYRRALDGTPPGEEDLDRLKAAFSRQGFSQGFWKGRTGSEMLGVREDDREDRQLFSDARATYETGETPLVDVRFYAALQVGKEALLAAEDTDGNLVRVSGDRVESAQTSPLTKSAVEKQLSRTGGTPYRCSEIRIALDNGANLPVRSLNAMRRNALDRLTAVRGQVEEPEFGAGLPEPSNEGRCAEPVLTAGVFSAAQITPALLAAAPKVLYVPLSVLSASPELIDRVGKEIELCVSLPRVLWDREIEDAEKALLSLREAGISTALCGNLGQVRLLRRLGYGVRGDYGLNLFNARTAEVLREEGLLSAAVSFELTLGAVREMRKPLPLELIAGGRIPLMVTENCLIRNRNDRCACGDGRTMLLTDRTGAQFPVIPDPGTCRSLVLNSRRLYLADRYDALSRAGLWGLRLMFTTETAAQVDGVLKSWSAGEPMDAGLCTRGLYFRGVE